MTAIEENDWTGRFKCGINPGTRVLQLSSKSKNICSSNKTDKI